MRYVVARLEEYSREMTYRFYVANSLQNIPQGKSCTITLYDLLYNQHDDTSEEKTGDDIVEDVMSRAGLFFED